MKFSMGFVIAIGALVLPGLSWTFAAEPVELQAKLDALIAQTDDEDFQKREEAAKAMADLPIEALPLVEAAIKRDDISAETRLQLERSLAPLHAKITRIERQKPQRARVEWYRRNILEAYERIGSKNPAWDEHARATLTDICTVWSDDPAATGDEQDRIWDTSANAAAAGCDDPLVRYARARNHAFYMPYNPETISMHYDIYDDLEKSQYHQLFTCFAKMNAADYLARDKKTPGDSKKKARQLVDEVFAKLPEILAEKDLPPGNVREIFDKFCFVSLSLEGDRRTLGNKVYELIEKQWPDRALALSIKGAFNINYAWDARGGGWSNQVTARGWELMHQRLDRAASALEESWKLNPYDPQTSVEMLSVELGQGEGLDRMEQWFMRAMDANPDNYPAAHAKLYYLEPKWHGSSEEMLAFGRECAASRIWGGDVPFILVDAHVAVARYGGDGWDHEPNSEYFLDPEVFREIRSVYENYFATRPESRFRRTQYLDHCVRAQQWDEAQKQLDHLKGNWSYRVFNREQFAAIPQLVANRGAVPPSTQPEGQAKPAKAVDPEKGL